MFSLLTLDQWRTVFIGVLTVGFLGSSVWYLLPFFVRSRQLVRAAGELRKRTGEGSQTYLPPKPLKSGGLLGVSMEAAWERFVTAWRNSVSAAGGSGPGAVSAEQYFTQQLLAGTRSRALPEALPGLFAGVGLLGTFIGIARGLGAIDITTGDPERLMDGVSGLMAGMATAFDTSIFGIFFSLLWLVLFRLVRHEMADSLVRFNQAAQSLFPYEEPEYTLMRMARASEEARSSLQTLGGDIAEALEGAMDRTVAPAIASVSTAMQGVSGAMGQLATQMEERELAGMEQVVESFRESLKQSIDEDLSRFAEALTAAADHQAATADKFTSFHERLERTSEAQALLLEQTTDVAATFSSGLEALTSAQAAIEQTTGSTQELLASIALLSEETHVRVDMYQDASQALQQLLATQLDATQGHVEGVYDFWQGFEGKVEQMTGELSEALAELTTFTSQKLGEVFERFDSEMATVVSHLGGTLAEVRSVTEELPVLTKQLAASVDRIPESVDAASQTFSTLATLAKDAGDRSATQLEELSKTVEEAVASSSSAVVPLGEALPPMRQAAADLAKVFDETNTQLAALRGELEAAREERANRGFFRRGNA